ncbi:MAG: family N-acetyltransferase [Frankiales bacterium]|nr:family N-acetyltransferase [Frankiales bacterium]
MRPIRPSDSEALRTMHRGLSSDTVYQRFFGWLAELPVKQADWFTAVDGVDRLALIALRPDDGSIIGVARYTRLVPGSTTAEVAFVVTDAYQHHGLGTALIGRLIEEAQAHGVTELVADVLTTNGAMHRAFRDAGLSGQATYDHGVAHLVMALP